MMEKTNTEKRKRKNLLIATLLNLVISVAELFGGILSGSLALFSDALHNLGDAFSTFIAWIALKIAGRESTPSRTFGYRRIEILAALLNSIILIGITAYLFFEAAERLRDPQSIKTGLMMTVAVIGLIANLVAVYILHKDSRSNLNVKAAYLHLIGDSLSSVVVILGAVLIHFFSIYWIDPLITFLIGAYILYEAFRILDETLKILMQNTPASLNLNEIKKVVEKDERIRTIHHIHAWSLTDNRIYFEAHVNLMNDIPISTVDKIRTEIEKTLKKDFDVYHTTLQFEFKGCEEELIKQSD